MSAQEIIAGLKQQLAEADKQAEKLEALLDAHVSWGGQAPQGCIEGLKALGYRILGPGEIDAETVEQCAKLIENGYDKPVGKPWRKDGKPSKNDECPHGRYMYEDCEPCAVIALRALAQGSKDKEGRRE